MKKILCSILFTSLVLTSVSAASKKALELQPIEIEPVVLSDGLTTFTFDSRTDVMGILCRLAEINEFQGYYQGDEAYTAKLDKYFGKYKKNKAVETIKSLSKKGIKANDFISLAFHIKPDFSGTTVDFSNLPGTLTPRWQKVGTDKIYALVTQIHDFVETSNYARIQILLKPDKLADVGYFRSDFEKLQLAQWASEYYGKMDFGTPVINVMRVCPGIYYSHLATDENGKKVAYASFFPEMYYSNMIDCYNNVFLIDFEYGIWDKVKDKFIKLYSDKIKKTSTEDQYKYFRKNFDPQALMLEMILVYPNSLNYYSSSYFAAYTEKEPDTGLSYDSYYSYYEKFFAEDYFYKLVDLFKDYNNNRDKYFNINDLQAKTITTVARFPDPKE